MTTLEYLNQAIDYIEENITQTLEMEEIAKAALLSKYYFQRVFHVITGITVADYVRNRRLSLAAEEIMMTKNPITDIALEYGYDSADAFTKAFRRLHGVTPSALRKGEASLKLFPKITMQVNVTGDCEMKYRIVQKGPFNMIGLTTDVMSKSDSDLEVLRFCNRVWEDGSRKYMLGWEVQNYEVPSEYKLLQIPAYQWIVFEHHADMSNPVAISELWKCIYAEWMPSSQFEQVEGENYEYQRSTSTRRQVWKCEREYLPCF